MNNQIISKSYFDKTENEKYSNIFLYIPSFINNEYVIRINDYRITYLEKFKIELTLPEIKGIGKVIYHKYYPYHLIDYLEIYLKNKDEQEVLFLKTTGFDLLTSSLSNNNYNFKYLYGEQDEFCELSEGKFEDDIIFKEKKITIPIELLFDYISIFPETEIIFKLKLNELNKIISYNEVFNINSLEYNKNMFSKIDLNVNFSFKNIIIDKFKEEKIIRKKSVKGKFDEQNLNSLEFKTCLAMAFYIKSDIFNNNNKFITYFSGNTDKKNIIERWIMTILKDMIIVSKEDFTNPNVKKNHGFNKNSEFIKIENNIVNFGTNKNCKIYIENVPDDHDIYYHSNILTFSRRKNINILNVSERFKIIKGIYLKNSKEIFFNKIKHDIDVTIASIPVNIWSHNFNSEKGDLRSNETKKDDFYINNSFILGMDFLSQDNGLNDIMIKAGSNYIRNIINKFNNSKDFKITEPDENMYKHIYYHSNFTKSHMGFIKSDSLINFNNFLIEINWKKYNDYEPLSLYNKIPFFDIFEIIKIKYDNDNRIIQIIEE